MKSADQTIDLRRDERDASWELAFAEPKTIEGFVHVRDILPTLFVCDLPRRFEPKTGIRGEQLVLPHFFEDVGDEVPLEAERHVRVAS